MQAPEQGTVQHPDDAPEVERHVGQQEHEQRVFQVLVCERERETAVGEGAAVELLQRAGDTLLSEGPQQENSIGMPPAEEGNAIVQREPQHQHEHAQDAHRTFDLVVGRIQRTLQAIVGCQLIGAPDLPGMAPLRSIHRAATAKTRPSRRQRPPACF